MAVKSAYITRKLGKGEKPNLTNSGVTTEEELHAYKEMLLIRRFEEKAGQLYGMGFIGGFYAAHFQGASPNLFSFDTMLLSLAMLVIGGIGRAEGAVIGTVRETGSVLHKVMVPPDIRGTRLASIAAAGNYRVSETVARTALNRSPTACR